MDARAEAIHIHAVMYAICFDLSDRTPRVDHWMRQIRLGLNKIKHEEYMEMTTRVHEAWNEAIRKTFPPEAGNDVAATTSEILMSLYNKIDPKYQNIYYTDKTFTGVINGFMSCHRTVRDDEQVEMEYGRKIADAFLENIGVSTKNNTLSRLKKIKEQNLVLEGKI